MSFSCQQLATNDSTFLSENHLQPTSLHRSFLRGLYGLALDESPAVRKAVCTGLVAMLMAVPDQLEASMTDLIEYMLKSTQVSCGWGLGS